MNVRNVLAGILLTVLFASCSNETGFEAPETSGAEGEAVLSVKVSNPATKAIGAGTDDKAIRELCVLIFKGTSEDARLEKIGWSAQAGDTEVTDIAITSGNKKVVVIANVTKELLTGAGAGSLGLIAGETGTTYSAVKGKTLSFNETEQNGSLSMNSKTYDITLRVSEKNYLGYDTPVNLYRNVAKVELGEIIYTANDRYPDFRLDVTSVFILHGHTASTLVGDGSEWGTTHVDAAYLNGSTNAAYKEWVDKIKNSASGLPHLKDPKDYSPWLEAANRYVETFGQGAFVVAPVPARPSSLPAFYVYENTNIDRTHPYTLLVVKGDFTYRRDGSEVVMKDRFYSFAVGVSGVEDGYRLPVGFTGSRGNKEKYQGVLRNLNYLVSFGVQGPGSDNPLDQDQIAHISATVKVRNWDAVSNNEQVN